MSLSISIIRACWAFYWDYIKSEISAVPLKYDVNHFSCSFVFCFLNRITRLMELENENNKEYLDKQHVC